MHSKLACYSFSLLALLSGGCTGDRPVFGQANPGSDASGPSAKADKDASVPSEKEAGTSSPVEPTGLSQPDGGAGGDAGSQSGCGNGNVEALEDCDDKNNAAEDGCFECAIETGWRCEGEPSTCTSIDECTEELDDCDANATCTDTPGSFTCECNDGFSGDGRVCSEVVKSVVAGGSHTCALLGTGAVRCWGDTSVGQLGYGNTNNIGDDEAPASADNVNVGRSVTQLAAGGKHTCALLDTGAVRCWGLGLGGRLGYGNTNNIGDEESPVSAGDVNVGGSVTQLAAGTAHTCALLDTGAVRCWGFGSLGRLGYGNTNNIGDDESPVSAGDVNVGGTVTQLAAGSNHTCALLDTGAVRCWGYGLFGQLGYGNTNDIGDDETPAATGDVNVGGTVTQLAAGSNHTCALLDTGAVRCWGEGDFGQLGYGNTNIIGDDETPAAAGDVSLGGSVTQLAAGNDHTCALLDTGAVRCWGEGFLGRLGYGSENDIGDDEAPASAGNVPVF